jgi:hypothetical protein
MVSLQVFKNTYHFENELHPCAFPRNDIEYITFILDFNIVKDIVALLPPNVNFSQDMYPRQCGYE